MQKPERQSAYFDNQNLKNMWAIKSKEILAVWKGSTYDADIFLVIYSDCFEGIIE